MGTNMLPCEEDQVRVTWEAPGAPLTFQGLLRGRKPVTIQPAARHRRDWGHYRCSPAAVGALRRTSRLSSNPLADAPYTFRLVKAPAGPAT